MLMVSNGIYDTRRKVPLVLIVIEAFSKGHLPIPLTAG